MSDIIQLPHRFTPRHYQRDLFKAFFIDGYKRIITVEHRRAGKDKCFLNLAVAASQVRVGTILYMFPTMTQAANVIWKGIDRDGMRYLDHIPQDLISHINKVNYEIHFKNGSILKFGGTNHYDRLMGINPIGYITSESQSHDPMAWDRIRPILAENGGWAMFNGTARGHNHWYKLYTQNKDNPKWFTRILTVDDTFRDEEKTIPVVNQEMIQDDRDSGMPEEEIQQEYYCSFEAALPGAYYAKQVKKAYDEQRIGSFPVDRTWRTYSAWDLGNDDMNAIWVIQVRSSEIRLVDYYQDRRQSMDVYVAYIKEFERKHNLAFHMHFAPHDIEVTEYTSGLIRKKYASRCGIHFTTVRTGKGLVMDGINAVRHLFQRFRFDAKACDYGIECIKEYHSVYNPKVLTFTTPFHNWASHGCDALRYFAVGFCDANNISLPSVRKLDEWSPLKR